MARVIIRLANRIIGEYILAESVRSLSESRGEFVSSWSMNWSRAVSRGSFWGKGLTCEETLMSVFLRLPRMKPSVFLNDPSISLVSVSLVSQLLRKSVCGNKLFVSWSNWVTFYLCALRLSTWPVAYHMSTLVCKAFCIVINYLILWSIVLSSSVNKFKEILCTQYIYI